MFGVVGVSPSSSRGCRDRGHRTHKSKRGKICQEFTHHYSWEALVVEESLARWGEVIQGRTGLGPKQCGGKKRELKGRGGCGLLKAL